jgi:hypothetical protein
MFELVSELSNISLSTYSEILGIFGLKSRIKSN